MAVTPKTGAIKFSELNTGIFNVSATDQIRLSDAGKRLGFSDNMLMSNLRGVYGFEITNDVLVIGGKFPTTFTGYRDEDPSSEIGSVNPLTVTGSQTLNGAFTVISAGITSNFVSFGSVSGDYEAVDADRFCLAIGSTGTVANVRTPTDANTTRFSFVGELFQGSGNTNCAVRFV